MKVLSHRGYWKTAAEKNSMVAFTRSFNLGFGTETDIRDYDGKVVISHDMADAEAIDFSELMQVAGTGSSELTLALNVKSDGLARAASTIITSHPGLDVFVFDMSVPDMRSYFDLNIPVFTRMSEVEQQPVWLDFSSGVWLDSFYSDWFGLSEVSSLLRKGKRVCVVSPELHGRSHHQLWTLLKPLARESGLMICTDFPEEAGLFFEIY